MTHRLVDIAKIVCRKAIDKQENGEVPRSLGIQGLLALMFDRIIKFNKVEDNKSDYVLELAADALHAFSLIVPTISDIELEDDPIEEPLEEEDPDPAHPDSRTLILKPGQSINDLRSSREIEESD